MKSMALVYTVIHCHTLSLLYIVTVIHCHTAMREGVDQTTSSPGVKGCPRSNLNILNNLSTRNGTSWHSPYCGSKGGRNISTTPEGFGGRGNFEVGNAECTSVYQQPSWCFAIVLVHGPTSLQSTFHINMYQVMHFAKKCNRAFLPLLGQVEDMAAPVDTNILDQLRISVEGMKYMYL